MSRDIVQQPAATLNRISRDCHGLRCDTAGSLKRIRACSFLPPEL